MHDKNPIQISKRLCVCVKIKSIKISMWSY